MYRPLDVALFTLSEFERGLAGLATEDAAVRLEKPDGGRMNAISWTVAHIARHWLARTRPREQLDFRPQDPAHPPPLSDARAWLAEGASLAERSLADVSSATLSQAGDGERENRGTALMRAVLHTWFHIGEINATRQLLGHETIDYLGPTLGRLEWQPGRNGGGYLPPELAQFALSEFARGLEGLTDDEAQARMAKAGGAEMNSISWTVAHISSHWLGHPERLRRFAPGSDDPTPPPLDEARGSFDEARTLTNQRLPNADESQLASKPPAYRGESAGTGVMRATLHTWFHIGEINAIRQQLGHTEIAFVGQMTGALEWRGEA